MGCKIQEAQGRAKRRLRKVVTGNPDKKVRDYMKEVPQVKLVDKISFTFGVVCIVITELLALRYPQYFSAYYLLLITGLLTNRCYKMGVTIDNSGCFIFHYFRFIEYYAANDHLFMLDFCYFMNLSVLAQTSLFPNCLIWYKVRYHISCMYSYCMILMQANYVLSMGVLMMAIVVWQNSLVFHSLDKLTSIFIHVFPPLTLHLYRLYNHSDFILTISNVKGYKCVL